MKSKRNNKEAKNIASNDTNEKPNPFTYDEISDCNSGGSDIDSCSVPKRQSKGPSNLKNEGSSGNAFIKTDEDGELLADVYSISGINNSGEDMASLTSNEKSKNSFNDVKKDIIKKSKKISMTKRNAKSQKSNQSLKAFSSDARNKRHNQNGSLDLVTPKRPLSLRDLGLVINQQNDGGQSSVSLEHRSSFSSSDNDTTSTQAATSSKQSRATMMQDLLEWQWDQTGALFMQQAQGTDVVSLLECLNQIKSENDTLENKVFRLQMKRDHLRTVHARLTSSLTALEALSANMPSAMGQTDKTKTPLAGIGNMSVSQSPILPSPKTASTPTSVSSGVAKSRNKLTNPSVAHIHETSAILEAKLLEQKESINRHAQEIAQIKNYRASIMQQSTPPRTSDHSAVNGVTTNGFPGTGGLSNIPAGGAGNKGAYEKPAAPIINPTTATISAVLPQGSVDLKELSAKLTSAIAARQPLPLPKPKLPTSPTTTSSQKQQISPQNKHLGPPLLSPVKPPFHGNNPASFIAHPEALPNLQTFVPTQPMVSISGVPLVNAIPDDIRNFQTDPKAPTSYMIPVSNIAADVSTVTGNIAKTIVDPPAISNASISSANSRTPFQTTSLPYQPTTLASVSSVSLSGQVSLPTASTPSTHPTVPAPTNNGANLHNLSAETPRVW